MRKAFSFVAMPALVMAVVFIARAATGQEVRVEDAVIRSPAGAGEIFERFGDAIAVHSGRLLVGSPQYPPGNDGRAFVYDTETGALVTTFEPRDGDWGFGRRVALDGNTAVVSTNHWPPPVNTIRVFDVPSGAYRGEYRPDVDGDIQLGAAIGVLDGKVIVGAPADSSSGDIDAGAVYVFDAQTGAQMRKLIPSDSASNRLFGSRLAVDGGKIAVLSVPGGSDATQSTVHFFDASTYKELGSFETPSSGAHGPAVAMGAGRLVVGDPKDDTMGFNSGAVTVYDMNGGFLGRLHAPDPGLNDHFGSSVSVSSRGIVIGAHQNDGTEMNAGAAYLFNSVTLEFESKLIASDTATTKTSSGAALGFAVAVDESVVCAGAPFQNDKGAVYVYGAGPFDLDTDGDGLLDEWEELGIPYNGGKSRYILPGADKLRKNLYVEVDLQSGLVLTEADIQDAIGMIEGVFDRADVPTPEGVQPGVHLQMIIDEVGADIEGAAGGAAFQDGRWLWDTATAFPRGFDSVRASHFGTPAERSVVDGAVGDRLIDAKAMAFRYAVIATRAQPVNASCPGEGGTGGRSVGTAGTPLGKADSTPGRNLVMFANARPKAPTRRPPVDLDGEQPCPGQGCFPEPDEDGRTLFFADGCYDLEDIAANLMHELGHLLGLEHGGGDEVEYKPNYPSIMNYQFIFKQSWSECFWELDYSHSGDEFFELNENSLDESAGIGGSPGSDYAGWRSRYYIDGLFPFTRRLVWTALDGSPAEFEGVFFSGGATSTSVVSNINHDGENCYTVELESLAPFNDWANLTYAVPGGSRSARGEQAAFLFDEYTGEQVLANDTEPSFPASDLATPCIADADFDGDLDFDDVLLFLQVMPDLNGSGAFDFDDVLAFLVSFGAGCP